MGKHVAHWLGMLAAGPNGWECLSMGQSTTLIQTEKSQHQIWTEIHGPQRMKQTDIGSPLTFLLTPLSQRCHLSCEIYHLLVGLVQHFCTGLHGSKG